MITPNTEAFLVVIGLETMAGLFSSAFIIFYLSINSIKERKVSSCHCILISLSVSNLCFTATSAANFLIHLFWPWLFGITLLISFLCIFYFIKVRQFQSRFLAWVKVKIDAMVPWLLLLVVFVSLFGGFLIIFIYDAGSGKNSTEPISGQRQAKQRTFLHSVQIFSCLKDTPCFPLCLAAVFPFVLALISAGITTFKLIKHIIKMKCNVSEHSCPNLQVLISTTRTMALLLIRSVIFYTADLLFLSTSKRSLSDVISLIALIIIISLPSAEGVIIIQATPRLGK
uniref:Taste receptor type 2 n=1 Tax=Pyxicephalus adspersus TaxID=30357 RepID=A0AAV2ZW87_PYXAD|nr:TPA: hypothetical protein GDO54_014825 [Pyxicephalus adspersus]